MDGIFGIVVNFIDMLTSMFVSLYNIVLFLGWKIVLWVLIFIFVWWLIRRLICVNARLKLMKAVKKAAKANGAVYRAIGIPILSVFIPTAGYDIELEYGGTTYRIKFFPGAIRGKAVHMYDINNAYVMAKWMFYRFEDGKWTLGKKVKIKMDNTVEDGVMNILCFAPEPFAVSEPSDTGGVWEHDMEAGKPLGGVYLLEAGFLARNLERLMEGYIDSIIYEPEDGA